MLAIPERLRGVITTRRYTNPRLPYLTFATKLECKLLPNLINSGHPNKPDMI